MARKRKGRAVDGIYVINKPKGLSSNQALQQVKRLFFAQKAGHTGNLDPMATGVLPICLGEATKFSQYLLDADKAYQATIEFGEQTTTGDSEGELLETSDCSAINLAAVEAAIAKQRGTIAQVPPMYSALKHNGQPLYKLARQGITIERKAREVTIYQLDLLSFAPGAKARAEIFVRCSKGTYIRTLAEDIASLLGVGAHLSRLHRTQAGQFAESDMHELADLQALKEAQSYQAMDGQLIAAENAVNHFPLVEVSETEGYYVRQGQAVHIGQAPTSGLVRIKQSDGLFLGIGEVLDDGRISPKRLIAS